ncbi:uncharacterized protein LOC116252778 [Nymphaea colorata]|nr:uncharacterized protein LOC116252778 [Nymphaea colorata]
MMARKKRLMHITSSSAIVPIAEPGDKGRVTRSRSRANAADVHTETCSLPDSFKPRKRGRGEAAAAASPSPNAKGTEEGLDGEQSFGRGEAAAAAVAASSSPNAEGTEDDIDGGQSHGRGEAAAAASPSPNAEGTEEGLDGEQSYGPIKEEARGDDDHGAIVVVDDPSDHDVIVMADDHDDPNDTSNTTSGGNTSNRCGGEDNTGTSLTGSAASQESLETIQTTLQEVANVMSAITNLLEEVQPISHASPTEAPSSPSSLQEYSKDSANCSRRKRGPTRALDVLLLPKGQKIKVMNNELGQAIGDNANKLSSFMGTIARNGCIAPLTYKDWRMMPQIYKDKMWNCLLEKFDIDKCMRRWVMMSLSTKWKNWKSSLKKEHYDTHETDEERLADCDERVLPDQWTALVRFWSSEEGAKLCERNKANRAKQTCIHTTGTKSFARIREEEKARTSDGAEPSRVEFFIKTHQKKGGQLVDDKASKIIAEFNRLLSELPVESQDRTTKDNIFAQVMGRDQYGRVRTYGLGPVPSDFYGPNPSRAESAARSAMRAAMAEQMINDLQKQIEQMQQENQNLQQKNQNLQQENQQLRQEKEKAKQVEEKSTLEKQLEEMWQENLQLLLGNDKLKEAEKKISNLRRQMDETSQENQRLQQENEKMKKQINKMMDILTNVQ